MVEGARFDKIVVLTHPGYSTHPHRFELPKAKRVGKKLRGAYGQMIASLKNEPRTLLLIASAGAADVTKSYDLLLRFAQKNAGPEAGHGLRHVYGDLAARCPAPALVTR